MAAAPVPYVLIFGRLLVGLVVGILSLTAPLNVAEVPLYPLPICGAFWLAPRFCTQMADKLCHTSSSFGFTQVPKTWGWMLGISSIPAILQFTVMLSLLESSWWLFWKMSAGTCLQLSSSATCIQLSRFWYFSICPGNFDCLSVLGLELLIAIFSPGMGPVPWTVNLEIHPLHFRGVCGGIPVVSNRISNLIASESFLSVTEAVETSTTFLIFGLLAFVALIFVWKLVPERKGLSFEKVDRLFLELRDGVSHQESVRSLQHAYECLHKQE